MGSPGAFTLALAAATPLGMPLTLAIGLVRDIPGSAVTPRRSERSGGYCSALRGRA
jgi:hypothetical protein